MTKLEEQSVSPVSRSQAKTRLQKPDFSVRPDSGAGSNVVDSGKSAARLTVAEKAFARGLKALRDRNYREAKRQLAGFLELTGPKTGPDIKSSTLHQSHALQGLRVVVRALELLLAISEEITILEQAGR